MSPQERIEDPVLRLVFLLFGWVLAVFAFAISILIVAGGEERWQGEAFQVAMSVPGAPETWGIAFGACAIILATGLVGDSARLAGIVSEKVTIRGRSINIRNWSRRFVGAGCTICGIWSLAIGTTFLMQLIDDGRQVSNIGSAVWFFAGIMYMLRAIPNLKILQP